MKILFTGASSFTGMWLANALGAVTATFTKESYSGVREERVKKVLETNHGVYNCSFGDDTFMDLIKSQKWDLFCHHAAEVGRYKSADFDVDKAIANNTHNLDQVLEALMESGCEQMVLTGSYFEPNNEHKEVSPYGLSKGLTFLKFHNATQKIGMRLGKFVIPNPFGPYENENCFTSYMARAWFAGDCPVVKTSDYIRDNIHVSLLARAYANFARNLTEPFQETFPSGYVEPQSDFARRFSNEMQLRFGFTCPLKIEQQEIFDQPKELINSDPITFEWDEKKAWDTLADYYYKLYAK